ncbi:hypothetical protein RV17_GL002466 [Enterococcus thailandicus]|nr:hypothetical protein RV17_GL002466 [Enterococcus thailandicus]
MYFDTGQSGYKIPLPTSKQFYNYGLVHQLKTVGFYPLQEKFHFPNYR